MEELPAGRLRTRVESLPPLARERATQWLRSFHFTEHDLSSLDVDCEGGIYFKCRFDSAGTPGVVPTDASVETSSGTAVPVSPFPSSLVFHSRPGAPNVLYLNFAGENVVNTVWNTELDRTSIPALPFSIDSDYETYSETEQIMIRAVWARVAEDFAPFDIDVTTERPSTFTTRTAVALVTGHLDSNGQPNPESDAGGVAYVNVFGTLTYSRYRPAWIYHDNLGNSESFIAEAVSHEIGHNLGLSHDGTNDGVEYYGGHGVGDISWGPIMGTGFGRNVTQWSKGEYYNASNTQDDLAIISSKIGYQADDHGNTAGTATPLTLTGKTNVVSTTAYDDPDNLVRWNKGVIEQNKDVDWFSFTTGTGPIRLSATPVVMLSGPRGGNLDICLELYDSKGSLLLSNNPPATTSACLETNLAAGLYYLAVRGSGAGDPFSPTPTGYTAYGSLGQYYLGGWITDPSGVVTPPSAELQISDVTRTGQTNHVFTVIYSDNVAIDVSTVDSFDIRVKGPNGYDRLASLIAVNPTVNGTPVRVTYSVLPPNGPTWTSAHNGLYTVWLEPAQVADTEGTWAPAGCLGEFKVAVPIVYYSATMDSDPGWSLDPLWEYGMPRYAALGPRSGATGTRIVGYNLGGDYENSLPPRYATTPPIDTIGSTKLSLRFQRWLRLRAGDRAFIEASTNGSNWSEVWSTTSRVQDVTWREVQYPLPDELAGSRSLRLRWGLQSNQSQRDIGWNIDDVEVLGEGVFDTAPPVATMTVANVTSAGAPNHLCTVQYTDETAVRLGSIDSEDIWVTGPNGYAAYAEFTGADVPTDASSVVAIYSIPAPGGSWRTEHNGTYTVSLLDGAVEDVFGHQTCGAVLGTFEVAIPTAKPGVLGVYPLTAWSVKGPMHGPFIPTNAIYTLTNSGELSLQWLVTSLASWVSVRPASGMLEGGASQMVELILDQDVAGTLAPGEYETIVSFVNSSTGLGNTTRNVVLSVTPSTMVTVTVSVNMPDWGRVSPAGGQFTAGSEIELRAEPAQWFQFCCWSGDISSSENPLRLRLTSNLNVTAVFAEQLTTNYPTPLWWLASVGYTNDFESAVVTLGANGLPLWQSYIAGLNPQDPESKPRLRAVYVGKDLLLSWSTVPGRFYTLLEATDPAATFVPLADAVDMPSSVTAYTYTATGTSQSRFFRLSIRKP